MPTIVSIEDEFENNRRRSNGARAITENQCQNNSTTTRVAAAPSSHDDKDNDNSSEGSSDDPMGIDAKKARGSIRKCRKVGAKRTKWKLNPLRGSHYFVARRTEFIPEAHCKLCKRRSISQALAKSYHHGHHKRCPNKPKNKGRLQRKNVYTNPWQRQSQQQSAAGTTSNGTGAASTRSTNQDQENGMHQMEVQPTSIAYSKASYRRMGTLGLLLNLMPNWLLPEFRTTMEDNKQSPPVDFAKSMRLAVDQILESISQPNAEFAWVKNCKAPAPFVCAIDLMLKQFAHRRQKNPDGILPVTEEFEEQIERYYEFYPMHSCSFQFPIDLEANGSPHYHQIEGQTIIYLDWQLSFPNMRLPCPHCSNAALVHERTNFGKSKSLHPIWNFDGSIT